MGRMDELLREAADALQDGRGVIFSFRPSRGTVEDWNVERLLEVICG